MAKMQEDQLRAITDGEMRAAVGYWSGKLAMQRQKAMMYYLGKATGDLSPPEVEGRSSVVSPDVRNTIESMMPQLMVKFAGGENVVEFQATKPGQEKMAEQATDYINHLYHVTNNGELISCSWMKDALLSKNGIVKVWWDDRSEETREEYKGLSEVELAMIADDDELEIIEQKSYPDEEDAEQRREALQQMAPQLQQAMQAAQAGNPQAQQAVQQIQQQMQGIQAQPPAMLWDIACKRSKGGGKVRVENVPPEEFLISRKAKSIKDSPFVGHRVQRTMSDLQSMGYKNIDQISGDDSATAMNMERIERLSFDDELAYVNVDQPNTLDDSQKLVWVTECYVRVDFDGDGISELRKVVRAGNQILENEIVDCVPFVSITPVPMPHKFFGLSIADLAMEGQRINTALLRGVLDNTYLQINGRYFAVENQVNLDDLLTSRPGGVVRIKQAGAAGRLDQGAGDSQLGMGMLEFMKGFQEDSTGWSRQSQGNDPAAMMGETATKANIVNNRADMRLDLIARNFAEGFRELFRLMLKLASQYQSKEDVIRLRGEWVKVNPREWRNGFDMTLNVGLGTGNKDQQVAHLNMLVQMQMGSLQLGTATPKNVYEAQAEMVKALGFKSAAKFLTDPEQNPPQPQPDPEQAKIQGQMQIEQMKAQIKAQTDSQAKQAEIALERERMQMQAQVDANRQRVEAEQKTQQIAQEMELERFKTEQQAQIEQMRAEYAMQTAIAVAKVNAEAKIIGAQVTSQSVATTEQDAAADAALDNDA